MNRKELLKRVAAKLAVSQNRIKWLKPRLYKELDGYFGKGKSSEEFRKYGLEFNDEKSLLSFLRKGRLTKVSDEVLKEKGKNITISTDKFKDDLKNQVYSTSFKHLEKCLHEDDLSLEAPILIKFKDGSYWGFSGNRRANLARMYGLPVIYYVVDQDTQENKVKCLKNSPKNVVY